MHVDLHHRPTLVKSWLATLHGPDLRLHLTAPLPSWAPLVRTAAAWHVAYALVAYAGALAVSRSAADNAVAQALRSGGRPAVVAATLLVWWGGVALSSAIWWSAVKRQRAQSNHAST